MELTNQATIETIDQIIDAKQCEIAEQKNIEYQLDWDSADISDVRMKRYTLEQEVQALVRVRNHFEHDSTDGLGAIKNLQTKIKGLEWKIDKILLDTADSIARNFSSCFGVQCEAYIMLGMKLLRVAECGTTTNPKCDIYRIGEWTLRVYSNSSIENKQNIPVWFGAVLGSFLKPVCEEAQPTKQPSVETMLQELKKSDNYLMSNPFKEEYESVFDR